MARERKIIRLPHFDYRLDGAYAVTICSHQRRMAFGAVENGMVSLNRFGRVVQEQWLLTVEKRPYMKSDAFVVMPNHFHAVISFEGNLTAEPMDVEPRFFGHAQKQSLSTIIGAFKSAVSREIGILRGQETTVWQNRFFEHIIRDDHDFQSQLHYIEENPLNWLDDEHHPENWVLPHP